jgi:ABC-type transport system involved in multi-copper enzyme maturation permease subunit
LSVTAYLAAKIMVFGVLVSLQTAALLIVVIVFKRGPQRPPVILGDITVELYVTLACTAVISVILGLGLSSLARSSEQVLPMLVMVIMVSIVFAGGLIPVTGRAGLDEASWLLPARWGFAASAATTDLRAIAALVPANEPLWNPAPGIWLLNMTMLAVIGSVIACAIRWRLRLRHQHARRGNLWVAAFFSLADARLGAPGEGRTTRREKVIAT